MSPTQIILIIALVWHLGLAVMFYLLWRSRRRRAARISMDHPIEREHPSARPLAQPCAIHPGRLVRLLFRSHAVFGPGVLVWQGTAAELLACLTGPGSMLIEGEKAELPGVTQLEYRLTGMMAEAGHYLRIERHDPVGAEPRTWRLTLNPEARRV